MGIYFLYNTGVKFKIDGKEFTPLMLAPLAGISDLPFRMLNRSFGCGFAFTEMISARSLVYQSDNTLKMLSTGPGDRPLGVQLVGNDKEVMKRAADILSSWKFDLLNINAACPVDKVIRKGEGAALMKDPGKLRDLLRTLIDHSSLPVTLKIRSGWDEDSVNAREVALYAREAGIKALFIHGRTRSQSYAGSVDYRIIREVKVVLDIPVIASGDALSPLLIKKLFDETGCDGVIIARGALGNPWIFKETDELLKKDSIVERPHIQDIVATMAAHLTMCCDFQGETTGTMVFRKFYTWYTKSLYGSKPLREKAFHATTKRQMLDLIGELGLAAVGHERKGRTTPPNPEGSGMR
jgi:tRNA-dihydrouridine synthase B